MRTPGVQWPLGRPRGWGRPAEARIYRAVRAIAPAVNVTIDVVDAVSGRRLRRLRGHNLVPTSGRNLLRDLLNGDVISGITEFALGTGNTVASNNDTALAAQILREPLSRTIKDALKLTAQYFLSSTSLNGTTIREAGLFTDEDTLFARYILDEEIAKTSGIAVTFTWETTFTVTEMNILERGSVIELGGSPDTYVTGNAYVAGATLDKIAPGSGVWYIDSADLQGGTFALEAILKVSNGTATPRIALVNLDDGAPNTALAGSEVAGTAGNQTGVRVRSGTITFPAAGAAKQLATKIKTDEAAADVWAWSIRIVRTS